MYLNVTTVWLCKVLHTLNLLLNDSSFYDDWLWLNIVGEKLLVCFIPTQEIMLMYVLWMVQYLEREVYVIRTKLNNHLRRHIIIQFCLANLEGFLRLIKLYVLFCILCSYKNQIILRFAFHTISILNINIISM